MLIQESHATSASRCRLSFKSEPILMISSQNFLTFLNFRALYQMNLSFNKPYIASKSDGRLCWEVPLLWTDDERWTTASSRWMTPEWWSFAMYVTGGPGEYRSPQVLCSRSRDHFQVGLQTFHVSPSGLGSVVHIIQYQTLSWRNLTYAHSKKGLVWCLSRKWKWLAEEGLTGVYAPCRQVLRILGGTQ